MPEKDKFSLFSPFLRLVACSPAKLERWQLFPFAVHPDFGVPESTLQIPIP